MLTAKDITRAMQYSSATPETLTLGAYSVTVAHDHDADSPYDAWEGNSPAIWLSLGNGFKEYGDSDLCRFFDHVTPAWVSRNWRAICSAMDITAADHESDVAWRLDAHGPGKGDRRHDSFADMLADSRAESWGYGIDYLETLRALYRLAGIPAETFQRNGYCQGDSVYGLIVMTPDWAESVGAPHAKRGKIDSAAYDRDMKSQADSYGAWAFGDVYGFTLEGPGAESGGCCGFYGSDPIESGLAESIADDVNAAARQFRAERIAKLKTWIRARVPYGVRAVMLQDLAQ